MAEIESLNHAKRKIELARLEESEILPTIQTLSLKEDQGDLFLLQLTPEILANLSEGSILTIRGDASDTAVICTKSSTYELKEAETSNSLLLMPEIISPEESKSGEIHVIPQHVSGIFHTYFELRPHRPNFKKLHALLQQCAYQGKTYEDSDVRNKLTFEGLLDKVQCSEEELKTELDKLQVCSIDGYVRVLDFDYKFNVLSNIINVIECQSALFDKVSKNSVIDELKELEPIDILEQFFVWYFEETETTDDNGHKLYAMKHDPVCIMHAEVLLRSSGKFHLQDFVDCWQRSVPEGFKCDLSMLRGIALTDLSSRPAVIFHFPVDNLSENITERFKYLFRIKEKWAFDEIVPYVMDLTSAGTDVKALLIKYTRESTKDGQKMYSSKW